MNSEAKINMKRLVQIQQITRTKPAFTDKRQKFQSCVRL